MTPEPLYSEDRRRPGRFWLITVAAVLTLAATVSLGRWQLSRAAQKEALQASIEAQKVKPPLTQAEFLALAQPSDELHRPVRLRGLWLTPQTVYLDNRQMHGVPGFYVLTPFALEGTEQTVMVQRGWVQRNFVDRTKLGAVETPAGIVEVTGLIEPPPSHLLELGTSVPAPAAPAGAPATAATPEAAAPAPAVEGYSPIRQNLDLEAFRAETKMPLRTDVSLQQTGPASEGLQRDWPAPALGLERHYGYCRPSSSSSMSGSNSSHPSAARGAAHAMAASDEPLGLTVHSMPSPNQALDGAEGRRTVVGRWKMIAVMLMCAAPVIASYFTYYVIRPEGRSVYGELIDPQRELPKFVAADRNGAPVDLATLKGQWLLVAVADAACDALCEQQLYLQRQLRESLGREKDRMDRVWLVSDAAPVPERLNNGLHGATVLRVPADELAKWLVPVSGHTLAEHLYVVDPMGHWMMRFPARMDAAGASRAKRDLDRLLRASASWDKPDR